MPKKPKDQTISSVSEIFGFLLEQSRKEPEKRRPIKPEKGELQADSEYVSTIVDALALPGTLVGDRYLETVESMVNPAVKVGTYQDRLGGAKIKLTDLPDFFDNPDKFVDELFEKNKNISKMQRIQWAGEQMRMLAGSAYAKKNNLFDSYPDPEMRNMLTRALGQTAMKSRQATDQIWMNKAADQLKNRGMISSRIKPLEAEYGKLQNEIKKYKDRNQQPPAHLLQELDRVGNRLKQLGEGDFQTLLDQEFLAKQDQILSGRSWDDLAADEQREYLKFSESRNLLRLWGKYDNFPGTKAEFKKKETQTNENKKNLLDQKKAIKSGGVFRINGQTYDYSTLSKSDRKRALKEINGNIKGLNEEATTLRRMRIWGTAGKLEGTFYGLQSTLGPGGLQAFANGDFFDAKKGYFGCPSIEGSLQVGKTKNSEVSFIKARKDEYLVKVNGNWEKRERKLVNNYNELMVNLYYLNPTTLMKTLFTGERFAWMANKKREELVKLFDVQEGVLAGLKEPEFWSFYKKYQESNDELKMQLLQQNAKYAELLKKVLGTKNANLVKKFEKAQELVKQFENLKKVAYAMGTPQRILNWVQTEGAKATQFARQGIANILMKMGIFAKDKAAKQFLESWVDKGVGKSLGAAISSALIGALGLAGTAVAGPLSFAITAGVSAGLEKVGKIAIKVAIFSLVGVFGVMLLLGGMTSFKKRAETDVYSYEVPGTIEENPNFESYGGGIGLNPVDDEDEWYDDGKLPEFVPGDLPAGERCLFSAGSAGSFLKCTQGPYSYCTKPGFKQPSHKNSPAIDVATGGNFNAPQFCDVSKGNCIVESVGQGTCGGGKYPAGGYVTFKATHEGRTYKFYILHTAPGVSTGQKLGAGQAVATIVHDESWRMCSTGLHAHVTVQVNGVTQHPRDVLNEDFDCAIGDCPVKDVCYIKE
jgi:hypothetical protein